MPLACGLSAFLALWVVAATPRAAQDHHRTPGASGYLPEHTLDAAAMAYARGADYLEQDVVLSRDGLPVVLHDTRLDPVTDVARRFPSRKRADGRCYVIDFTLAELKQLKVTERISPSTGKPVFPGRFLMGKASFEISTSQIDQGIDRPAYGNHLFSTHPV